MATVIIPTTSTTPTAVGTAIFPILNSKSRLQKVEEGLRFIISHFDPNEPLWPRTISTHATGGKQIAVNSIEEAMAWFEASDFLDCRISAFPLYNDEYINRTDITFVPTIVLCDLDREHFGSDEEFEGAVEKTLINFEDILGVRPTLLWTGNGYHFILPQSVIKPLEKIEDFKQFAEPSRKFLHFEEWLMTDGKADQVHNRTVSFRNCMLRIPGSLNFGACNNKDEVIDIPPEAEVRVVQSWDGNRPDVNHLLPRCYMWLKSAAIKDMQDRIETDKKSRKYRRIYGDREKKTTFQWIENLLNKPIDSNRYYCTWRILVPYLINVRGLSREEALEIIQNWMSKCKSIKKLSFNIRKVKDVLKRVGTHYPIAWYNLEKDNKLLYQKLKEEGVIY